MSVLIQIIGLIFLCGCASSASVKRWQLNGRIVGGSSAVEKQFPYQVSLCIKETDVTFCGGVIINENYVLTAAHCFLSRLSETTIYGLVNITHTTDAGTRLGFTNIVPHPHFRAFQPIHDLALLRTNLPIEFSEFVKKVNLPIHNFQPGSNAVMSGWGLIEVNFL